MPFFYTAYGLKIGSSLALPELQCINESAVDNDAVDNVDNDAVAIWIKHGVCDLPPEVREREWFLQLEEDVAFCYRRGVGGFMIRNGQEIVVEAAAGVADSLLRPFLLGVVLAFALYQRGLLVLHSSSVAWRPSPKNRRGGNSRGGNSRGGNRRGFEYAVGFMGYSQAGKSTMAAALHQRNHCALSDDLVVLRLDPASTPATPSLFATPSLSATPAVSPAVSEAGPQVYPGHLHLKLRSASVEGFGYTTESGHTATPQSLPQWNPDFESYLFQFPERTLSGPLPLRCLYALEEADEIAIEPLEAHQGLMKLINNSFCIGSLSLLQRDRNFLQCVQLARQVPLFRLKRPLDFDQLPQLIHALEIHQNQLLNT